MAINNIITGTVEVEQPGPLRTFIPKQGLPVLQQLWQIILVDRATQQPIGSRGEWRDVPSVREDDAN
jgi:hypothetical protein